MSDGKANILGSATALPATSGAGLLLMSHVDPLIIGGLFAISFASLIVLIGSTSRYLVNAKRHK